jgi:nitrogen-specific signal transduction histidine kinase
VSAGKENGVGLGLTLAQHIAQEHGGEVKLEQSAPGATTFSVILYKRALLASRRTQVEENVRPADSTAAGAKMSQEQL